MVIAFFSALNILILIQREMSIGERIKKLRKRLHYTQLQVQKGTGIPQSNLSEFETGKLTPQIKTLKRIAEFLGVSVSYLLGEEDVNLDKIRLNIQLNDELSEGGKAEILDFIEFVKQKEKK